MARLRPWIMTIVLVLVPLGLEVSPLGGSWVLTTSMWGVAAVLFVAYHARTLLRVRVRIAPEPASLRMLRPRRNQSMVNIVEQTVTAAKGRLDFEVEGQQAYEDMGRVFEQLTKDTVKMGERLVLYGKRISRASAASKRLKLTKTMASDMDNYTGQLDVIQQDFTQGLQSLNDNIIPWIQDDLEHGRSTPDAKGTFKNIVTSFMRTVVAMRNSTTFARSSMEGLQGQSQDLNMAVSNLLGAYTRLIDTMVGLEQHCDAMLALLGDD